MKLAEAEPLATGRHVAIGTFDGVHIGHRQVIDDAETVLTFDPHPLMVINPDVAPKLITRLPMKAKILDGHRRRRAGPDRVQRGIRAHGPRRIRSGTC